MGTGEASGLQIAWPLSDGRLTIRPASEADAESFFEYQQRPEAQRYVSRIAATIAEARAMVAERTSTTGALMCAIEIDGQVIGDIGGLRYRPGDEAPTDGSTDDADWLVLTDHGGGRVLAVQQVDELPRSTWPTAEVPMQVHLDHTVTSVEDLEHHRARAETLGATVLLDRSADEDEHLYVFADPAGHPFCIFVA